MNEEKLFEALADIDENYVIEAHKNRKKKHKAWIKYVAMAAGILIFAAVGSLLAGSSIIKEENAETGVPISNTTVSSVFARSSVLVYVAIAAVIFVIIFAIVEYRKRKNKDEENRHSGAE